MKKKQHSILVLIPYYLPGFKGGGPIQSIANIVEQLGDEFSFNIVTSDRDFKETKPYPGIKTNTWDSVGKARVFYMSPKAFPFTLQKVLRETPHDLLYLNGYYHPGFAIMPLWMRRFNLIPVKPALLAPRNEFNPNFMKIKAYKKKPYISTSKLVGINNGISFHATTEDEARDINKLFSGGFVPSPIFVAREMIKPGVYTSRKENPKCPGHARFIYLSRVHKTKNLLGALRYLSTITGRISFDIYGPVEDQKYLNDCLEIAAAFPNNIKCTYKGPLDHEKVNETLSDYHFFFLPTWGENFGHVIWEALSSGCIPIISDQTPWRDLEKMALGWDLPLNDPTMWQETLQHCVDMGNDEYTVIRKNIYRFVSSKTNDGVEMSRNMFLKCIEHSK